MLINNLYDKAIKPAYPRQYAIGRADTFLGAFGIAQLFWGPWADKYGKPRMIMLGLLIFASASVLIFFTKNVQFFLILRTLQAFGVCAATVCWQALVIEKYPSSETSKIFSSIMPLVALSPALAPLIGVYILQHAGWRYIFLTLALIAVVLIGYSSGLRYDKKIKITSENNAAIGYFEFLKKRYYLGNVLIYAFCSAGFFAWLTGAPFFLKEMGYTEDEIGWSFVPQTITFMAGGFGLRFLFLKIKAEKLLPLLLLAYAACMIVILILVLFTTPTLTTLLIPFSLMAFCNGATYPIVVNQALMPFKENSGKASALQNTVQLGICFVASSFVSLFSGTALLSTSIVMAATIFFVALGWLMIQTKHQ